MQVSISYKDLEDASKEAEKVAKRFDDYADELQQKIANKLSSYNGPWTSNLADAYSGITSKINELRADSQSFFSYSNDLSDLVTECKNVDVAVKTRISTLSGQFSQSYISQSSIVTGTLVKIFTSVGKAAVTFLVNTFSAVVNQGSQLIASILNWLQEKGVFHLIGTLIGVVLDFAAFVVGLALIVFGSAASLAENFFAPGWGQTMAVFSDVFNVLSIIAFIIEYAWLFLDDLINLKFEVWSVAGSITGEFNPDEAERIRDINSISDYIRDDMSPFAFLFDQDSRYKMGSIWDEIYYTAASADSLFGALSSICSVNPVTFLGGYVPPYLNLGASYFKEGFPETESEFWNDVIINSERFGIAPYLSNRKESKTGEGYRIDKYTESKWGIPLSDIVHLCIDPIHVQICPQPVVPVLDLFSKGKTSCNIPTGINYSSLSSFVFN